jgi:hypothetical protein
MGSVVRREVEKLIEAAKGHAAATVKRSLARGE